MSGGHYNYLQHNIVDIYESIQQELNKQGKEKPKEDLWMNKDYYKEHPEEMFEYTHPIEIQKVLKEGIYNLKKAYIYAQRIDWYLSGDDGDESFIRRLTEELDNLENKKDDRN